MVETETVNKKYKSTFHILHMVMHLNVVSTNRIKDVFKYVITVQETTKVR